MSWNYRVIRHGTEDDIWYGVHEVYYNGEGKPEGWTNKPILIGSTPNELLVTLERIKESVSKATLEETTGERLKEITD